MTNERELDQSSAFDERSRERHGSYNLVAMTSDTQGKVQLVRRTSQNNKDRVS